MSSFFYQSLQGLGLSEPRLLTMLQNMGTHFLEDGQLLSEEAQAPDDLFHVITGLVCTCMPSVSGAMPLEIYGPGSWFCSAVPKISGAGPIESLTQSHLLCVPANLAADAFHHEPSFAQSMAQISMWRGQMSADMLALTKVGSPAARVVLGLALLVRSLTCSASHLPGMVVGGALRIPIKQLPLARYLGLSRRSVSSSLQALSDGGWLRLGYGSVDLLRHQVWADLSARHLNNACGLYESSMAELLDVMKSLDGCHA